MIPAIFILNWALAPVFNAQAAIKNIAKSNPVYFTVTGTVTWDVRPSESVATTLRL